MVEYYICGTTRTGKVLPREHGMTVLCIQQTMDAYTSKYPDCIYVNIDIALHDPVADQKRMLDDAERMPQRRRNFLDGG